MRPQYLQAARITGWVIPLGFSWGTTTRIAGLAGMSSSEPYLKGVTDMVSAKGLSVRAPQARVPDRHLTNTPDCLIAPQKPL